jgi:hypothetical protein
MRQFDFLPDAIKILPRDKRGFPVPAFAEWIDGEPDFRVVKQGWRENCVNRRLCWICGCRMGDRKWFVTGPMCTITRTTSEPPCHAQCAEFAVRVCPFLTMPLAKRNERDLPEDRFIPGIHVDRNPGVACVWETRHFKPFRTGDSWLIEMGDPLNMKAWAQGREATRAELVHSIETGLPALAEAAAKEGEQALLELRRVISGYRVDVLDRWYPKDVAA